jgi:hypothetical protein
MKDCGHAEVKQQIWLRKKIYEYGNSSAQSVNEYYSCVIRNPVLQEALSELEANCQVASVSLPFI